LDHAWIALLVSFGLLLGILVAVEAGRRIRMRGIERSIALGDGEPVELPGRGAVDSAVFGLMGLLLAFTFSGALGRWEGRRDLAVAEANAIGTAWLRIDLLRSEAQPSMREGFRGYLDARIETYRRVPDMEAVAAARHDSATFQASLWREATVAAPASAVPAAPMLLLPALNEMFDLAATRLAATQAHPPPVVYFLLFVLVLASALVAGHAMPVARVISRVHIVAFAFALAATVYVVLDMEYPRLGFIRIDEIDRLLIDLRQSMN